MTWSFRSWILCWFAYSLFIKSTVYSLSEQTSRCIVIYKPALTLCTLNSHDGSRDSRQHRAPCSTLADFSLPEQGCGRLDRDSEGLLLLTNDGQFTHEVLCEGCHKTYWALVQGEVNEDAFQHMRRGGLEIRGAVTRAPLLACR